MIRLRLPTAILDLAVSSVANSSILRSVFPVAFSSELDRDPTVGYPNQTDRASTTARAAKVQLILAPKVRVFLFICRTTAPWCSDCANPEWTGHARYPAES